MFSEYAKIYNCRGCTMLIKNCRADNSLNCLLSTLHLQPAVVYVQPRHSQWPYAPAKVCCLALQTVAGVVSAVAGKLLRCCCYRLPLKQSPKPASVCRAATLPTSSGRPTTKSMRHLMRRPPFPLELPLDCKQWSKISACQLITV